MRSLEGGHIWGKTMSGCNTNSGCLNCHGCVCFSSHILQKSLYLKASPNKTTLKVLPVSSYADAPWDVLQSMDSKTAWGKKTAGFSLFLWPKYFWLYLQHMLSCKHFLSSWAWLPWSKQASFIIWLLEQPLTVPSNSPVHPTDFFILWQQWQGYIHWQ